MRVTWAKELKYGPVILVTELQSDSWACNLYLNYRVTVWVCNTCNWATELEYGPVILVSELQSDSMGL